MRDFGPGSSPWRRRYRGHGRLGAWQQHGRPARNLPAPYDKMEHTAV
ncbi:unnamed protein product [Staurois parvus]|uniref:Uncharacterized protein n=1 Tax=Staurois parvus TaxID=386267 RepID=A0ABN9GY50_9NEOB|nr:unnamed protein product [Staurois parvus]